MSLKGNKIPILDSLRAFAALSVCLFHFVCTTTGFINTKWILRIFSLGQYGVQLFFVISGFVIPWAMHQAKFEFKNFFTFFLKRLTRLEPPYIFSLGLALILFFLRNHLLDKSNLPFNISLTQVALHIGYLIPFFSQYVWLNLVYWTLAIEFQYYVLIGLLFIPFTRSKWPIRVALYAILILMGLTESNGFLPYWLPIFLIGISLFLFFAKFISVKEYAFLTLVLVTFCVYKYSIPSLIFMFLPVLGILLFKEKKIKILDGLGKFSYSIYLLHPLIGGSFINMCSHTVSNSWLKIGIVIGGLILTLGAAYMTYIFIEKPSKALSASIKY